MENVPIVGIILVAVGVLDAIVGLFVVVPRVRDERTRGVVRAAILGGSVVMIVLGALFLTGRLGT